MLALNDEALRLTAEGEVSLGVPHDIIYPYIPPVCAALLPIFPREDQTGVAALKPCAKCSGAERLIRS
jgi:hypothetical protein